jgi:hypothetical protein
MNPNEAATALDGVDRTQRKLAQHAHWPFHRHAMFGLGEGLLIAAIAQPISIGASMMVVAVALFGVCMWDDRRRHGMFVSGFQPGKTRWLTALLVLFVAAMGAASLIIRDGVEAQPLGFLAGLVTFAVCTAASLQWQKIYRSELERGGRP